MEGVGSHGSAPFVAGWGAAIDRQHRIIGDRHHLVGARDRKWLSETVMRRQRKRAVTGAGSGYPIPVRHGPVHLASSANFRERHTPLKSEEPVSLDLPPMGGWRLPQNRSVSKCQSAHRVKEIPLEVGTGSSALVNMEGPPHRARS